MYKHSAFSRCTRLLYSRQHQSLLFDERIQIKEQTQCTKQIGDKQLAPVQLHTHTQRKRGRFSSDDVQISTVFVVIKSGRRTIEAPVVSDGEMKIQSNVSMAMRAHH